MLHEVLRKKVLALVFVPTKMSPGLGFERSLVYITGESVHRHLTPKAYEMVHCYL